jgi:threonine dehydrogenase-like Zn-dependent dehydrogenase
MLTTKKQKEFCVVGIDLNESRREKMKAMYAAMDASGKGTGEFVVASVDESKDVVRRWTNGVGFNAALEVSDVGYSVNILMHIEMVQVVGNNSALTLAYDLVRPFGCITSVGVHGETQLPFTGQQVRSDHYLLTGYLTRLVGTGNACKMHVAH